MKNKSSEGSGFGSVGRAVAFDTRGLRFDSRPWQNFIEHLSVNLFIINCIEKTKINKKRPGIAHFFKNPRICGVLNSNFLLGENLLFLVGTALHH